MRDSVSAQGNTVTVFPPPERMRQQLFYSHVGAIDSAGGCASAAFRQHHHLRETESSVGSRGEQKTQDTQGIYIALAAGAKCTGTTFGHGIC